MSYGVPNSLPSYLHGGFVDLFVCTVTVEEPEKPERKQVPVVDEKKAWWRQLCLAALQRGQAKRQAKRVQRGSV